MSWQGSQHGDSERRNWELGAEHLEKLIGKNIPSSFEDLKSLLPGKWRVREKKFGAFPYEGKKYVLDEGEGMWLPVGYRCGVCDKDFIGAIPDIKDYNELSLLSGREGYRIYCNGCENILDNVCFRIS